MNIRPFLLSLPLLSAVPAVAGSLNPLVPYSFGLGDVDRAVAELRDVKARSGLNRFLLTGPGFNEVMYAPFDAGLYAEMGRRIGEIKKRLEPEGFEIGWWCAPSIRYWSDFPSIEDAHGNRSKDNKKCPLDSAFQADWAAKVKSVVAAARPKIVNIEDDYTLAWGRGLDGGACFCQRHLAAFAKRYGKALTGPEIADAFKNRTNENLPVRQAFADTVRDSLCELARAVRAAVDEVDPSVRIMLCESGSCSDKDGDAVEAIARAFAGPNTRPGIRPSGAIYGAQTTPADIPGAVSHTMYTLERLPRDMETFYEADPYPHNRFYTSASQMLSLMAGSLFAGSQNILFYCLQYLDDPLEDPGYVDAYRAAKPRLDAVLDFIETRKARLAGVRNVWRSEDFSLTRGVGYGHCSQLADGAFMLSKFGIPYTTRKDAKGPALVIGNVTETMPDEEIRALLAGGVLLDATAAAQLAGRGFGDFLGADVTLAEGRLPVVGERILPAAGLSRKGRTVNAFYILCAGTEGTVEQFATLKPRAGTETWCEFTGVGGQVVTPSVTFATNALGGRVALLATSLTRNRSSGLYNLRKQELVRNLFARLGGEAPPVCALDVPGIWTLANVSADGDEMLVMVNNLSGDVRDDLAFAVDGAWRSARISRLAEDGRYVGCGTAGARWTPHWTFGQMQPEWFLFSKKARAVPEPQWIWTDTDPQTNTYARFTAPLPESAATLRISVAGNFVAYVDGEPVGFGQYTDHPWRKTYSEIALPMGRKDRALQVDVWYGNGVFTSHNDGLPGVWAEVLDARGARVDGSGTHWRGERIAGYATGARTKSFVSLNWTWAYDARGDAGDANPQFGTNCSTAGNASARGAVLAATRAAPVKRPLPPCPRGAFVPGKVVTSGDGFRVYDLGEERTGLLRFKLKTAKAGATVEIVNGEYLQPNGRLSDCTDRKNGREVLDRYVTRAGAQEYRHWFRRYGCRYFELRYPVDADVEVAECGLEEVNVPGMDKPAFACSNPFWEKAWDISWRTLRCCRHEKYENCPGREQSICPYDARNQQLFSYGMFGDYEHAAAMIELYAAGAKSNGFIKAAEPYGGELFIPMFTFPWMTSIAEYGWYSGDASLFRRLAPQLKDMLGKILAVRKDGLYLPPDDKPRWDYCEAPQMEYNAFPPNAFYNLYLHEALLALAPLFRAEGDGAFADRLEATARELGVRAEAYYWDEAKGGYADCINDRGEKEQYHALIQSLFLERGLVPAAKRRRVLDALKTDKFGVQSLATLRYLVKGVWENGTDADRPWAHEKIVSLYRAQIDAGTTTWWETSQGPKYAGGSGSLCHGWSAMIAWYITEYVMGVRPTAPGYATYEVKPRVPGLSVKGSVATPRGRIPVDIR